MDVNRPIMPAITASPSPHPAHAGPGDADLARRVAAGDHEAATTLIDRYQDQVRRFLTRLTGRADLADDLAQETFIRVLQYAGRYDDRYPMRTWLFTIARRLSINQGRRRERVRAGESWRWLSSDEPGPDELASEADERRRLRRRLDEAMQHLTDSQHQALVLFHEQGLSIQEAAQVMDMPAGTVKSHLHRARATLRQMLGSDGAEP